MDFPTFNYQIITFLLSISKININTAAIGYVICLFFEGPIYNYYSLFVKYFEVFIAT